MKEINCIWSALLGVAALVSSMGAQAALPWSPEVSVDRISPVYENGRIYVTVVNGANNKPDGPFCTGGANNNVRYMWFLMTDDPERFTYSALLTLISTGKKAKFSVNTGTGADCRLVTVETCGVNTCETF